MYSGLMAGALNQSVELKRATETQDAETGEVLLVYRCLGLVYASVQPMRGDEKFRSNREMQTSVIKVKIRYRCDLLATDEIVWNGTTYDITNMAPLGRMNREWIELLCEQQEIKEVYRGR